MAVSADPRERLKLVRELRGGAEAQTESARAESARAVKDARAAGIPVVEISELLGVTRETVYQLSK